MSQRWTTENIMSQRDRTIVVTGTGGLGLEEAFALALAGENIIIAGRDPKKGQHAVSRIRESFCCAAVRFELLDLADLGSISAFGERLAMRQDKVDVLINNADVISLYRREVTRDEFELQLGVNYFAQFALTAHLLPLLRRSNAPRVVTHSHIAAHSGAIDFGDLQAERRYESALVYSQSRLACLLFSFELQRRSDFGNWGLLSTAAHSGLARAESPRNAPGRRGLYNLVRSTIGSLLQSPAQGALPALFAATSPAAQPTYYGPSGIREVRGHPARARIPPAALEANVAKRLWKVSEQIVGIRFETASRHARSALRVT